MVVINAQMDLTKQQLVRAMYFKKYVTSVFS